MPSPPPEQPSPPPEQPAPTAEDLAARLRTSIGALVRATRPVDRLAPIPAAVLDLLDTRGPMTTADLAARRGVRHQTMATTVRDLAAAGHLTAAPDPGDARKKILTLTPSGKAALDADRRRRVGALADALTASFDEDDRRALAHALDLLDRLTATVTRNTSPAEAAPMTGPW
ncbi:MarR family winged helix-turn-helix transcriptional regulator [Actinomadura gamaensis]|uniref:MarR family winged helix-turn-helix transcriptional regulator n=1 Tax=Actinomadura gamaensis TaxID=1763541 RepID=A0ABV9TV06_9ACTN